jgi:DNA-binding transcriptional ArsR family regulator
MEPQSVVASLFALAHLGRLDIFRLLVKAGPGGVPAGEIARSLAVMPNALSANLRVLSHAGLISSRRDGRSIIYAADYEAMSGVLGFLMEECCGGDATICAPLAGIANRAACASDAAIATGA